MTWKMTLSLAVACSHIPEVENRESDEGEGKIWKFHFAHDWTFQGMFFIHTKIIDFVQAFQEQGGGTNTL